MMAVIAGTGGDPMPIMPFAALEKISETSYLEIVQTFSYQSLSVTRSVSNALVTTGQKQKPLFVTILQLRKRTSVNLKWNIPQIITKIFK